MAHSYLKEALVSVKQSLSEWEAENLGAGLGMGLGYEILATTLGGYQQGRQIEDYKALLMIEHVTHLGTSVQDGRTRSQHEMRINVRMGDVMSMAKLADRIYDRMHNFEDSLVTDTVQTKTLDIRYLPDSVGLDFQFEDEYTAYVDFRLEITEI